MIGETVPLLLPIPEVQPDVGTAALVDEEANPLVLPVKSHIAVDVAITGLTVTTAVAEFGPQLLVTV